MTTAVRSVSEKIGVNDEVVLSVVVSCYDFRKRINIFELLDTIRNQTYRNLEAIFVVDRSRYLSETIQDYAKAHEMTNLRVVFHESRVLATEARNFGAQSSNGRILAFVDDDASLAKNWAEELVKTYDDEKIVGVTGEVIPAWGNRDMRWFPKELEWIVGCSGWLQLTDKSEVGSVIGTNASFRRLAFLQAGGYALALGPRDRYSNKRNEWRELGEESELSFRIRRKSGGLIVYNPKVRVIHSIPAEKLSLGFIAQRSFQVGRTRRIFIRLQFSKAGEHSRLEKTLLVNTISMLLRTLGDFFRSPSATASRFTLTSVALFFLALGYMSAIRRTQA